MPDDADFSSLTEIANIERALRQHQSRQQSTPQPEFDDKGQKICIDCGLEIPPKRAIIKNTVRCLECQQLEEKYNG